MFIINITYKVDLNEVDKHLEAHVAFLNKHYELKNFLASGRKVPRSGGIIIANAPSKLTVEQIIEEDPFKQYNLADYHIIEFTPSKTSKELEFLIE